MENGVGWETLKEMRIGDILELEKIQPGIHNIIERMKENVRFCDEQIKSGNFAEDLVGSLK